MTVPAGPVSAVPVAAGPVAAVTVPAGPVAAGPVPEGPVAAGPAAAVGSVPELFGAILRESPQAEAIVDGDCRLTFAGWWHRAPAP